MRTKTTTREGTWNAHANFPLKKFLDERGWRDLYYKVQQIQYLKIITDARDITDDPEKIKIISNYLTQSTRNHPPRAPSPR